MNFSSEETDQLYVLQKQSMIWFAMNPPMGQLAVAVHLLTFSLVYNQSMSFHDVTTATLTITKAKMNIKRHLPQFTRRHREIAMNRQRAGKHY